LVVAALIMLAACGHRTSSSVALPAGADAAPLATVASPKDPATIPVMTTDITDRKYHALGDVSATVSKNNIFEKDPTPAMVDEALQKEAAKLGADAVILVRYGTVGIGVFTWGKLDGNGRAIVFDK
jgi:uncharacterized protein YbjQ (UPF0145 family)